MTDDAEGDPAICEFDEEDELQWHQLDLLRRIADSPEESESPSEEEVVGELQSSWGLSDDIEPYPWQEEAVRRWEENDRRGVVKVVTGAGKTVMALMCVERILRENEEHHISIVVPTRVLMDQWYEELTETLRLPEDWVGRKSGEYSGDHSGPRRVVIYVINSAREHLGRPLDSETLSENHTLIVDECHRAGSDENSRIFDVPRRWALGLSATPERNPDEVGFSDDEFSGVIREQLGSIIYSLAFEEALEQEIIPPFELINCAVRLSPEERDKHERLSRQITDTRKQLKQNPDFLSRTAEGTNEFAAIQTMASRGSGRGAELAEKFRYLTGRRKELLYRADNRIGCFRDILETELEAGANVMAFHERISEINHLYCDLIREDLPVVMDHNSLTSTQRDQSLDLYHRDVAPVLLSVRALIEGVNAPATDVGVIVASSSSPRQRIQSIGRVLRRYPGKDTSRIYNIYVEDSADEYIFKRVDFEDLLGAERTEYRRWNGPGSWETLDDPPYTPLPRDTDIPANDLTIGDPYPGREEGIELSMDSQGNIYREIQDEEGPSREYARLREELTDSIKQLRSGGGPVRISPSEGHVLIPTRGSEGEWELLYAGTVEESITWDKNEKTQEDRVTLIVSSKHGGSVRLKEGRTERYDPRSPASERIQNLVEAAESEHGCDIHRIHFTESRKITTRIEGSSLHLGQLEEEDGWPFGTESFEELQSLSQEEA